MTTVWRRVIQIAFLGLFKALLVTGKMQLWMGIFVLGVLAFLFWSRLYCGWICPINTTMEGISFVKKKNHLKSFKIPRWLSKPLAPPVDPVAVFPGLCFCDADW